MSAGDVPLRVVVCDDQDLVRTGYVTILSSQPDLEVVGEAADGEEAVRLAERLRPDVVVMDIRMPRLDGVEATQRLAGPGVADPLTVLVVTTFNVDAYVLEAFRAGASGFLLKEATAAELVAAVRTVAQGDALVAPAVTRALIGAYGDRVLAARPSAQAADDAVRRAGLSAREVEIVRLIAEGRSNAEIAAELFLSHETIKTYVSRILGKLGLRDRVQVVVFAFRHGLADPAAP